MYSGRASRLARQAAQAKIEFLPKGLRHFQVSIGDPAHQCDTAARTVTFELGFFVGWTSRQAHSAVDALLEDRIIQAPEVFGGASAPFRTGAPDLSRGSMQLFVSDHQSKILPGFKMLSGSSVRFNWCINSRLAFPTALGRKAFLARPTPCSPVIVPPSLTA